MNSITLYCHFRRFPHWNGPEGSVGRDGIAWALCRQKYTKSASTMGLRVFHPRSVYGDEDRAAMHTLAD